MTHNPDGTVHRLEIKSGGAKSTPYRRFTDLFVNFLKFRTGDELPSHVEWRDITEIFK